MVYSWDQGACIPTDQMTCLLSPTQKNNNNGSRPIVSNLVFVLRSSDQSLNRLKYDKSWASIAPILKNSTSFCSILQPNLILIDLILCRLNITICCPEAQKQPNSNRYLFCRHFQTLAAGVLDRCWNEDRLKTSELLVRISSSWGGCTTLGLAYRGRIEDFMAESACASKLQKIMYGDLSVTTPWYCVRFSHISYASHHQVAGTPKGL